MDDVRAVLEAVGSEKAALFGISEGGAMSVLFAVTYPPWCCTGVSRVVSGFLILTGGSPGTQKWRAGRDGMTAGGSTGG